MPNYLGLTIPLRTDAQWFVDLRNTMKSEDITVEWRHRNYHITTVFIYNDQKVEELTPAFSRLFTNRKAPTLTLDTIDAFMAKKEIIVSLTSSQMSKELKKLIEEIRQEVKSREVNMRQDFILHITLGKIVPTTNTLQKVTQIINNIKIPSFTLYIKKADYRYLYGKSIKSWEMI